MRAASMEIEATVARAHRGYEVVLLVNGRPVGRIEGVEHKDIADELARTSVASAAAAVRGHITRMMASLQVAAGDL